MTISSNNETIMVTVPLDQYVDLVTTQARHDALVEALMASCELDSYSKGELTISYRSTVLDVFKAIDPGAYEFRFDELMRKREEARAKQDATDLEV